MKKLLIASTALSLAGGAAFAEMAITVSGDAELGVDYASEPVADATTGAVGSKHSFVHEVGIDFEGSGTTDGGLAFGGKAGFDTGDDVVNTGEVYVSGSFGKLTIGDNDAADLTAGGIADIGMNGIGVDDMVEGLRGTTAAQLRYDNSFGQVSIAISAGTKAGSAAKAAVPATVWHINDHMTGDKMTTHVYYPDLTATGRVAHPDGVIIHVPNPDANDVTDTHNHLEYTINWDATEKMYYGLTRTPTASATVPGTIVKHEFDSIFGVIHRSEDGSADDGADNNAVIVDLDLVIAEAVGVTATQAAADQVNIYGFMRNDKDQIVGPDGKVYAATTDHGKAFTRYEANYNLGGDKKVGGTGKTAEAENRDTVKVASNAMAAVPAVASDSEFAFGMSFNAGGVTIGVGYDSNKTVNMGAGFTTGEITTSLLYVKTEDNEDTKMVDEEMTGMGVDMAYTMGASKVTLAYGRRKPEMGDAMDAVGMDVEHDLGGDATLKAGFGKVDKMVGTEMVSENKASIGLMFTF